MPLRNLARHSRTGGSGLYRIRGDEDGALVYVGQGAVPGRPLAHLAKTGDAAADHDQGRIFAAPGRLECSWVLGDAWLSHQRLELENDLIAAHVLETGQVPLAQFLG